MTFDEFQSYLDDHRRAIVQVGTADCSVCHAVEPKVRALAEARPGWSMLTLDAGRNPEVAGQLLVFAAPTVIVFVDGREVGRVSRSFAIDALRRLIDRHSPTGPPPAQEPDRD